METDDRCKECKKDGTKCSTCPTSMEWVKEHRVDILEGDGDAAEAIERIISLIKEDQDRFIFECITQFCTSRNEIIVPKQVLDRALTTFIVEHTSEWKELMKKYGSVDTAESEE